MEGKRPTTPSVQVLKQMSITRQDLEKSSEQLADKLARLQKDNAEQQQIIEERLSEVQKEQTTAEQLLQSDWQSQSHGQDSRSVETTKKSLRREPTIVRQLRQWSTSDVIRWLEKEGLHKFILTFQRHHVKGEDLAEIRLPFLDNYDHISVDDKELLLSHVYELLRLESEEQESIDNFASPLDKEKYIAARQISKDEQYKRQSSPVIFLPSHSPSTSPPSQHSSPIAKLRKCSDPTISTESTPSLRQRKVKTLEKPPRKKKSIISKITLFDLLGGHHRQEVKCVCIQKKDGNFGFTLQRDSTGNLGVVKADDNLSSIVGSRVIEINGYLSSQLIEDRVLQSLLRDSQEIHVVLIQLLGNTEDEKWSRLRNVLTDMRDKDIVGDMSSEVLNELKNKYSLQEEMCKAKEEMDELKSQISTLLEQLSLQTKVTEEMKEQRDEAIKKRIKNRFYRSGSGEYYKMTMESLNVEKATKEQVTDSLKEIVKEASRQKLYLDRLISVVIEESPWLLDQVDADFDDNALVSQSEEFC